MTFIFKIRFDQADDTCHTLAVVDFVPRCGTAGKRVSIRGLEFDDSVKKLVLMVLPKVHPPCLSIREDIRVDINSTNNTIPVSTLFLTMITIVELIVSYLCAVTKQLINKLRILHGRATMNTERNEESLQ